MLWECPTPPPPCFTPTHHAVFSETTQTATKLPPGCYLLPTLPPLTTTLCQSRITIPPVSSLRHQGAFTNPNPTLSCLHFPCPLPCGSPPNTRINIGVSKINTGGQVTAVTCSPPPPLRCAPSSFHHLLYWSTNHVTTSRRGGGQSTKMRVHTFCPLILNGYEKNMKVPDSVVVYYSVCGPFLCSKVSLFQRSSLS